MDKEPAIKLLIELFEQNKFSDIKENLLEKITIGTSFYANKYYSDQLFYRVIKYKYKPTNFIDTIYPPKEKCKIGRANKEDEQIFYCANEKNTALYEINGQENDLCIITKWRVNRDLFLNTIGYSEKTYSTISKGDIITLPDRMENGEKFGIAIKDKSNVDCLELLGLLFSKENLIEDEQYYLLTNRIFKNITGGFIKNRSNRTMDGLKYPTIRREGKSDCFALYKHVVDNGLIELLDFEFVKIKNSSISFEYEILDYGNGVNANGELHWLNLTKSYNHNSNDDDLIFVQENNEIKCYTIEGELKD